MLNAWEQMTAPEENRLPVRSFLSGVVGVIGQRSARASLFDAGTVYPVKLRPGSVEGQLALLLLQDVEPLDDGGCRIKQGTSPDRIPSAADPAQRHGLKSKRGRFTGHKRAIAVEPESQTIAAADAVAKTPVVSNSTGLLPKSAFVIDLEANTVTCPEGHSTAGFTAQRDGARRFRFGSICMKCA